MIDLKGNPFYLKDEQIVVGEPDFGKSDIG